LTAPTPPWRRGPSAGLLRTKGGRRRGGLSRPPAMWWAPATSATQAGDRPTKQCLAASVADRTGIVTTTMCTFVTIQRVAQHRVGGLIRVRSMFASKQPLAQSPPAGVGGLANQPRSLRHSEEHHVRRSHTSRRHHSRQGPRTARQQLIVGSRGQAARARRAPEICQNARHDRPRAAPQLPTRCHA
jgi:hypothetical protein